MAETYYLKLLGFPELRRADGRPVKLKVRKHLALLIYLVVDGREVYYRDELADLLWPEVPEENSRHSLSMAFSVLRGLFGSDCIGGNHAEVRFQTPAITTDLDQLEQGEVLAGETAPRLEVDAFLRDFLIEDAPAFQHWRDRRNAQLLPMLQSALMVLADQARRSADMPGMLALAERLLALDPLSEEGVRAQMEAFAMQGDRIGALRIFEAWKVKLFEELGAVPSDILEGMAARLRRQTAEPTVTPAPVALCTDGRFVGRTEEYRALFEAWESTTQFNTRHVLITGESGIGKSTLALRFASAAALEGAAVARVQCFELEQRIAFGMIGALITNLLDKPSVSGTAPEALAEIARVVPRVKERFPHLPVPKASEGEAARLRFAEGTFALLEAIMEDQPLVLIVDDYPRSDEASLSVLHMLLRRATNERLMVVLAGRPPEPDEPAQAGRIRAAVSHLTMQRIELAPMSEGDSEELIAGLLSNVRSKPGSPERRAILRTAGGNPMAMELLVLDWRKHGEAALAVLLPAMGDVPGSAMEAIGYDRLIERILPNLSPKTRLALYLAAILGPRLNDLDSFQIVELTPLKAIAALSELIQASVLRSTERGIEFVNELLRARLYLKIPNSARVRLHEGVASHLLGAKTIGTNVSGLEIAWHCIRGRKYEMAVPYLLTGAREAVSHGAPDEAVRALGSALGQLKGRPKAEASLLLAETYQEMGAWSDALNCISERSEEISREQDLREMSHVLRLTSEVRLELHPARMLRSVLDDLIIGSRSYASPSSRVYAVVEAAYLSGLTRSPELVSTVQDTLRHFPLEELTPTEARRILVATALTDYHVRNNRSGLKSVVSAANLSEKLGTTDSTFVQIHTGWGAIATAEGRYDEALEHGKAAFKGAKRIDNLPLMAQAATNSSLCCYRLGRIEESLEWAVISWETYQPGNPYNYIQLHAAARCSMACLRLSHERSARMWLGRMQECARSDQLEWIKQASKLFEADIYWLLGEKNKAVSVIEEISIDAKESTSVGFVGPMARWVAVSASHTRQPNQAKLFLTKWLARIEELDALDRAELLCGLALVETDGGSVKRAFLRRAQQELSSLPAECSKQLAQLGLRLPTQ